MSRYLKITFILIAILITLPRTFNETGFTNVYMHEANTFLKGQTYLVRKLQDVAIYKGLCYVPFPPFPAIVLLPFVAVFGFFKHLTFVVAGITIFTIFILSRIFEKLDIEPDIVPWVIVGFFMGTSYWMCVFFNSNACFFAHIVAVCCIFMSINEALGKGRGLLVGLFLGMAFLSRQLSLYSSFFIFAVLWENHHYSSFATSKEKKTNLFKAASTFGLCILAYLVFNWVRFDNPLQTGYSYILQTEINKARFDKYGLFHYAYVPFNFVHMFLQGFWISFKPPAYVNIVDVLPYTPPSSLDLGTSLTFASPFLFIAFFVKWKKNILRAAYLSIGLAMTHMMLYYINGAFQINGQRYTLDFLTIVILLVALGAKEVPRKILKFTVTYSVALNSIALLLWLLRKNFYL